MHQYAIILYRSTTFKRIMYLLNNNIKRSRVPILYLFELFNRLVIKNLVFLIQKRPIMLNSSSEFHSFCIILI